MPSENVRRVALIGLVAYAVALGFVLLNPSASLPSSSVSAFAHTLSALHAPDWLTAGSRAEFIVNALILVPLPLLGSLLWRASTWRDWTAYAFVISASVEAVQGLLLPLRSATFVDVVSNTLGGAIGGLLAVGIPTLWARRPRRRGPHRRR